MAETGEIAADPDRLFIAERRRELVDLRPLIRRERRTWKFQFCHRKQNLGEQTAGRRDLRFTGRVEPLNETEIFRTIFDNPAY
jgi:hypothetical protein